MTLLQIKYIIEIVNCKSITGASKKLYISQPSLSQAVKELEKELGIIIFNRTPTGVSLSAEGAEFLSYARQVYEQSKILEEHYKNKTPIKQLFSVSTQHYSFSVRAFSNLLSCYNQSEYDMSIRETRTYEIIEDVKNLTSEIGVLYKSDFNKNIIEKFLNENHLDFYPLFEADAHIFISTSHPLADRSEVSLEELEDYPFLCFEQGNHNSFYFSEEMFSDRIRQKIIRVSDRATLFNLLVGLNGYTVSSGVINTELYGNNILAVKLNCSEKMTVGYILNSKTRPSQICREYIEELKKLAAN